MSSSPQQTLPLLQVEDLYVEFSAGRKRPPVRAVDGVSLSVQPRETVGLVGESGSGKTTLGRAILGLAPIKTGTIRFAGADITNLSHRERRPLSTDLQVVFQDPYSSLNPSRTIGQTLGEPLRVNGKLAKAEVQQRVVTMLEKVGLSGGAETRYPAHFSGGQRQRIAIARALMTQPRFVICDEPVSALDLSVQAQVLNLLRDLQHEFQLSYLFIAHDLDVVRHLSNRIVVLYRGQVMEEGPAKRVYEQPLHPYTRALLDAAPVPDPQRQRQRRLRAVPSVRIDVISDNSCVFAARCPHATDRCHTETPQPQTTGDNSRVACHHWRHLSLSNKELRTQTPSRALPT